MPARRILAYGAVVAVAVTAFAALSPPALSLLDLRIRDAMLRASATRPPSGRVLIVAVDDHSLSEVGQWPWPRDVLARLVDGIRRLGARAIAVDLLLAEPDRFDGAGTWAARRTDSALAAVLAQGRVVMNYALTFDRRLPDARGCVLHPVNAAFVEGGDGRSPIADLFHATGVACSLPDLNRAAGASGYLNAAADADGLLRRLPMLMELHGEVYPSLALAAVLAAADARHVVLMGLPGGRARLAVDRWQVPLDDHGTLALRFRGRAGTFRHISASDVLIGRLPADALRDRIVFLGTTALGVEDLVATPSDTAMPGIEVQATAADTLLQRDFISSPPYARACELALTLVLGFAAAVLVASIGFRSGTAASGVVLASLWWAAFLGVDRQGIFLSPLFPTAAVVVALLALTFARLRHERRRAEAESGRRERAHHFVVHSLTSLIETRDAATGRHARRTREYSRLLATRLAPLRRFRDFLTPDTIDLLSRLSPLHDLGKVGIRDAILNKAGPLSDDELREMRRHPAFGYEAIARAEHLAGAGEAGDEALVRLAKDIVYTHHERWDGRGYPCGLKGEDIPIAGRIVALVDVYDALTDSRVYRARLTHEQAVAIVREGRGTQFDPDVVDAFLALQDRFRELAVEPAP